MRPRDAERARWGEKSNRKLACKVLSLLAVDFVAVLEDLGAQLANEPITDLRGGLGHAEVDARPQPGGHHLSEVFGKMRASSAACAGISRVVRSVGKTV